MPPCHHSRKMCRCHLSAERRQLDPFLSSLLHGHDTRVTKEPEEPCVRGQEAPGSFCTLLTQGSLMLPASGTKFVTHLSPCLPWQQKFKYTAPFSTQQETECPHLSSQVSYSANPVHRGMFVGSHLPLMAPSLGCIQTNITITLGAGEALKFSGCPSKVEHQ